LNHLPEDVLNAASWLRVLNLDDNEIEDIDSAVIEQLRELRSLSASDNRLTSFPADLRSSSLTQISLDRNNIRNFRVGESVLPQLRSISLRYNGMETVDADITRLTRLEVLDLSENLILSLPEDIYYLTRMRELILSSNPDLLPPASIVRLTNLSLVDLSDNHLTTLPPELGYLPESVELRLSGNFFEESLQSVMRNQGSRAVLRYARSLGETTPNNEAKLLLVGEGNVGKTSLVEALRNRPFVEGRPTTHGIEINIVRVSNPFDEEQSVINLRSWDFGGQEVYRVTHQFFFSPRSVYLVVWRPREGQHENAVESWVRQIRLRVRDDARIIIVATHGQERQAELDIESLRRQFGSFLAGTCTIDSKTGYGIDVLNDLLGRTAATLPQIGEPLNVNWTAAREELLILTDSHIARSTFDRICARHDISEEDAEILVRLLADLGYIVYFPDDDGLKDVILLQPEWLTKAISRILEDGPTREGGGVLDHYRLGDIWTLRPPHLPSGIHSYVLRLMEKFDVSYRIPDSAKSLVGQLVPYERPRFDWPPRGWNHRSLSLECEFDDNPPGLIPWLIVRNHRFAVGKHWRRGVLLRHTEYQAEGLYEFVSPSLLRLRVYGEACGFFFDILRDTLTYLCDTRWPGLNYRLFVPCPAGQDGSGTVCSGRFPLRSLELLRERGASSIQCIDCLETWNVHELLSGFRVQQEAFDQLIHAELIALRADLEQTLIGTRAIIKALANEVTDCPRLFAVDALQEGHRFDLRRAYSTGFYLTLWCEEPGAEHPVGPPYTFRRPREWFADVAPYLYIAARTITLLAPSVGAASAVFLGGESEIKRVADFMTSLADSSAALGNVGARPDGPELTRGEGGALRRFRELLLDIDPTRQFADLRRVLSPTGDYLWVCQDHEKLYEPGMPVLPRKRKQPPHRESRRKRSR
jgi:GTPase SAR1 family protein